LVSPIVLVTRLKPAEESAWLDELAAALPEERFAVFRALSPQERAEADIAVVADPDPADVAALPKVKWIHGLWAGVERLVAELGPGAPRVVRLMDPELSRTMAEAVLAWTHYLQRDMPAYRRQQHDREWRQLPYRAPETLTIGLLGLGVLGTAAARRLIEAGFPVMGWSRSQREIAGAVCLSGDSGLERLLNTADIVVCLVPQTPATRGLIGAGRLNAMKPGAALINFARGPVVVADDVVAALDSGRLSHAVLDVFDVEPLPADSPLWDHPAITVLPHISAPTNRRSASKIVAANIRRYRRTGQLPPVVDREQGY